MLYRVHLAMSGISDPNCIIEIFLFTIIWGVIIT